MCHSCGAASFFCCYSVSGKKFRCGSVYTISRIAIVKFYKPDKSCFNFIFHTTSEVTGKILILIIIIIIIILILSCIIINNYKSSLKSDSTSKKLDK
jgi:intein-encoded DNA endonuclease-like protein